MSRSTPHAYQEWWDRWLTYDDETAANRLVEAYMPLVYYHVQRIGSGLPKNVSKEELLSHGLSGLYDAMKKFDFSRDLKFDTYASFRIRGAIIDGLRQEDWMPRSLRDKSKKIEDTIESLEQKYGRYVSEDEVGEMLDMDADEVRKVVTETFFANMLSIDEETPEGEREETYRASIEDTSSPSPEDTLVQSVSLQELAEEMEHLSEKEKTVIGLFYQDEMTLTEIGEIMGLSTSRISQIHSKALFRLKQTLLRKENF
ncbi:RNA polymerase sigma factor for flagellar operon FliA [Salibacterium salarium]|uniref:FliA/WhiG family RNA polymerase sigma factor n=1 Tax=Salibacterium salarium TaxID=284579 RepID=A0A428N308_9BACI|nr:FliA/WhiG family RNA polymerase sigma factor [Salibacterium salarium]MDQ0299156.1 RNA polymerase sigma factor for flagellar operon FliA [Salibacterium salarium]RSL32833.1 FliA/WhiG family RNA polymerase sigma factor [Salibacterium salarium]